MRNPNNFEKKVKKSEKKCTNSVSTHSSTIYNKVSEFYG